MSDIQFDPKITWVLINWNNLFLTQQALDTIIGNTELDQFVVIVDNNSDEEGTNEWLDTLIKPPFNQCCHVIKNKENLGFIKAVNQSMTYIVDNLSNIENVGIVNNDVIIPPNAIKNLLNCLDSSDDIGIAVPCTNYASGRQQIKWNAQAVSGRENIEKEAQKYMIDQANKQMSIGYAIGLCMLMKFKFVKEIYDLNGGLFFNPDYGMGNYEDAELVRQCISVFKKRVVMACDSFIYHYGSESFKKDPEKFKKLLHDNEEIFRKKWDKKQRIVAGLCIKNESKYIDRVLSSLEKFVDEICILDDASTDNTVELCKKYKKVTDIYINEENLPRHEGRDRARMHKMITAKNPDWIIACDGDEIFEDNFIRDIQKLCNPIDLTVDAYTLKVITFWRGEKSYRVDGLWGNQQAIRLFRNREQYKTIADIPFHSPPVPVELPSTRKLNSTYRLKHYGYASYEECVKKYKFYTSQDTNKDKGWIGSSNYDHLVNEEKMELLDWVEDHNKQQSLSVCMICKNEEENVDTAMKYATMLGDEVIVVDTGSTDNTIEKLKKYEKVKVFESEYFKKDTNPANFSFAKARNESVEKAASDWIIYLDFDDTLDEEEIPKIRELINKSTHCIIQLQTRNVYDKDFEKAKSESFAGSGLNRLFRNHLGIKFKGSIHEDLDIPKHRKLIQSQYRVFHWGYNDQELFNKKQRRNEILLLQEIKNNRHEPMPYFHLARSYLKDQAWSDALKNYKKFIKRAPPTSRIIYTAYVNMAQCLANLGKNRDAVQTAYKAVAMANTLASAYMILGQVYTNIKYYPSAKLVYKTALSLEPPPVENNPVDAGDYNFRPAINLAKLECIGHNYSIAINYLHLALESLNDKYHKEIFNDLHNLYNMIGKKQHSEYYKRLHDIDKKLALEYINEKGLLK